MKNIEFKIFISLLEMIKNEEKINKSSLARRAGVDRKTISFIYFNRIKSQLYFEKSLLLILFYKQTLYNGAFTLKYK